MRWHLMMRFDKHFENPDEYKEGGKFTRRPRLVTSFAKWLRVLTAEWPRRTLI